VGEFAVRLSGSKKSFIVPNILHDEGASAILRAMFPPFTALPPTLKMTVSGAYAQYPDDKPNMGGGGISAADGIAVLLDAPFNPHGSAHAPVRDLLQIGPLEDIHFTSVEAAGGARLESDGGVFHNNISWQPTPRSWYRDVLNPPIPTPARWKNWKEYEPVHGFPWHEPVWHTDWFRDEQGSGDAVTSAFVGEPFRASSWPIQAIFIYGGEPPDEVLFVSGKMLDHIVLKPGQTLFVSYRARFQARAGAVNTITPAMAKLISDTMGAVDRNLSGWEAALSTRTLQPEDTIATLDELNPVDPGDETPYSPGYARKTLGDWTVPDDPPGWWAEMALADWVNSHADLTWQTANSVAIIAHVDPSIEAPDGEMLAWSIPLLNAITLGPSQSLGFNDPVRFELISA
jgi:hypothetical protein